MKSICSDSREKSRSIYDKSCTFIPFGVNSPVRAFSQLDLAPLIVRSGYQDEIVDVDGHHYLDFCQSWGALIHGHAHSNIVEAVQRRVAMGSTFGIATEEELLLAQKVIEQMPVIEQIRFVSSGTEATMSAIRLARGFTGRDYIVKFSGNYHGHADHLLVRAGSGVTQLTPTSSSLGIPSGIVKYTISLPYNCLDSVKRLFRDPTMQGKIAAVIIEPVAANMGVVPADPPFLTLLREECTKAGTLLIFDEVISGFRLGLGGATAHYKITPDLIALGKVMGGGYPAAAFGGRRGIMQMLAPGGGVYQAGTLSGNPVAMVAGYETIKLCERPGFYQTLEEKCRMITQPVAAYIQERGLTICVQQVGSLFTLFFGVRSVRNFEEACLCDLEKFAQFYRYMFERGVYLSPSQFEANFVSDAHQERSLLYTRDLILKFLSTQFREGA